MKFTRYIAIALFCVLIFNIDLNAQAENSKISGNSSNTKNDGKSTSMGSSKNSSNSTDYGLRFSLVSYEGGFTGKKIGRSVDWYRKNIANLKNKNIIHSKHGTTKLEYTNGNKKLNLSDKDYNANAGGYAFEYSGIWKVYGSGAAGKSEKKKWLKKRKNIKALAENMNVSITDLKNPKNRIVVEPVFYFHLEGKYYGLTAHEIALKDEELIKSGKICIRQKHLSRSHKAIPSSDYLEREEFGIEPLPIRYRRSGIVYNNETILKYMGISIFRPLEDEDKPKEEKDTVIESFDYIYRCDTDVYTSVILKMGSDSTPESPLTVSFDIPEIGILVAKDVYAPKGYEQMAWVKWHTPKEPKDMIVNISSNKGGSKSIKVRVEKNSSWEPHNPLATDIKPDADEFSLNFDHNCSKYCNIEEKTELQWSKWEILEYQNRGDFKYFKEIRHYKTDDKGHRFYDYSSYVDIWDEEPYWSFGKHDYIVESAPDGTSVTHIVNGRSPTKPTYYNARLVEKSMKVKPAQTCERQNREEGFIKSGYGIETRLRSSILTDSLNEVTGFQTSKFFFPEFNYKMYWRLGDRTDIKIGRVIDETIEFPQNFYSYTGYHNHTKGRYHFLPIWYPDGNYKLFAKVYDCWTPAGELRYKVTDDIVCKGSLWEDWHIQVVR